MSGAGVARLGRARGLFAVLAAVVGLGAGHFERPVVLLDPMEGKQRPLRPGADVLHVVFFATWCKSCLDELRALAELEAEWSGRGYELVLVAVPSRQTSERLAAFGRSNRPPGTLLFDEAGELTRDFEVDRLPAHFLFGPRGELLLRAASVEEGVAKVVSERLGGRRRGNSGS